MPAKETLTTLIERDFSDLRFIAVSNREPYIHRFAGGQVECVQPASGLATALDPILRASGGTWIAHGSGDADRLAVDARNRVAVPPQAPSYTLRRVWLDAELERRYYYGLANEGLWPLCHIAYHRPVFRLEDWRSYREANRIFAQAVLEEADGRPAIVFIQDYHFGLLPRMIKTANPNLIVAQFWHIPWPNRETFRVFPWKDELLDGLLGNDLLGFHLRSHCSNFLETVDRGLEALVDTEHSQVRRAGGTTLVRQFPISIDFERHSAQAAGPAVKREMERWRRRIGKLPEVLGIGIDRIDYTKGIPDRLRAVDLFLERHPEYRGRFGFVQVAVPSRERIPQYHALQDDLVRLAEEINARWADGDWKPIHLFRAHFAQHELMGLHRLADFCLVSSLHDGMNLVAKEFVSSRTDGDGVLILSEFAGAARELKDAIIVNPFSPDQMADAILKALTMAPVERRRRMRRLVQVVRENDIYRWAADIFRTLARFERPPLETRVFAAGSGAEFPVAAAF